MNRHTVIGFKKGESYKRDLGEAAGISDNLKAAKELARKAIQDEDSKFEYCTIHNCKKPQAKVGGNSIATVVVMGKDVMAKEAKAKKAKEPKTKKKK